MDRTVLLFDIETNGLLDTLDTIHCLCIRNPDTDEAWSYGPTEIKTGLTQLRDADCIAGHNIIGFDLPAIKKLYPKWSPKGVVRDTMVLAALLWPREHMVGGDQALVAKNQFPKNLIGRNSLEAWGHRLGDHKGDYKGGWEHWSQAMQDYCEQDVIVTQKLWKRCLDVCSLWGIDPFDTNPEAGKDCVDLEHRVAEIIQRQEAHGFAFDVDGAFKLYGQLKARQAALTEELQAVFPPDTIEVPFIPKVNNKSRGYVKGELFIRKTVVPFNPSSRQQCAERLRRLGWVPEEFTDKGQPKIDDDVLSVLDIPQAKVLAEYFMLDKRLGQIGEGSQAWLRTERNGRIHGRVVTNGAVTGRMTHRNPNMAQVPSSGAPYGKECRGLFTASVGNVLVGCDADALELRCLAHYMAMFDGGAYVKTVLEGKKEDGTDMHTLNAQALGCSRDVAKVYFYAFIYGAGNWKLGYILAGEKISKDVLTSKGREARNNFLKKLPAMKQLVEAVGKRATTAKFIRGLDGRRIAIRSEHAALNSLLQSAGAIAMKRALVFLDSRAHRLRYAYAANVHDEWQMDCHPDDAEPLGEIAADSIRQAGDFYGFRCPLKGNYDIGQTWADTH